MPDPRFGLAWFAALTAVLMQPVALAGDMTWYDEPGVMRNGYWFDPAGATCAVDDAHFNALVGKSLLVCTPGRCAVCHVTDSGWLAAAGVVLDVTPAVFRLLAGRLGVGRIGVRIWQMR